MEEEIKEDNKEESKKVEMSVSSIEEAKKVVETLKEQNEIMAKNLEKAEELRVNEMLSGKATAGVTPKEKTKEEKARASAREVLKGTGYEDQLFPQ